MNVFPEDKFKEICQDLVQWKKERKLTFESQIKGYLPNFLEEVTEFNRAINDEERIDALCDIIVFSINSHPNIDLIDLRSPASIYCERRIEVLNDVTLAAIDSFTIPIKLSNIAITNIIFCNILQNLVESLERYRNPPHIYLAHLKGVIEYTIFICIKKIYQFGYDPYLSMKETIKEISSRTGIYSEEVGKWVKDTGEEAKKKWYTADYTKAKLDFKGILGDKL